MLAIDVNTAVVEVTTPNDMVELLSEVEITVTQLCSECLTQFPVLLSTLLILVCLKMTRNECQRTASDG